MAIFFIYAGSKAIQYMNNYSSAAKANLSENTVVKSVADSINLQVPFITQAPFMLWKTYPFETTCEETCALMMHYYLSGIKTVDENITKQEILSIVDFENKTYGFSDDTNAAETARFIRDYYKYDAQVYYNISIDDIKRELNEGNPVIVPTAGRLLFNPNFTPPGPISHEILIKGYDSEGFITNDPGTYRTGADKKYSYKILENALHNLDHATKNADGPSAMIVVTLPKTAK